MKYLISWRTGHYDRWRNVCPVIRGLRIYASPEAAQAQIAIWSRYFHNNTYYIERI